MSIPRDKDSAVDYVTLCREYPDAEPAPVTFVPDESGGYWVADLPTGERVVASGLLTLGLVTLPRGFRPDLNNAGVLVDGERHPW